MVLNFFPIRTSQVPFQAVNLSIYLNLIFKDKRLLMSMLPCGIRIKLYEYLKRSKKFIEVLDYHRTL